MKEGACAPPPLNARTFYPEQLPGGPGSAWGGAVPTSGVPAALPPPPTLHTRRSSRPTEASSQAPLAFVSDAHISPVSRTLLADALRVRN